MDMRIFKYPLPVRGAISHQMPLGAQIQSVGEQEGQPFVWAMIDADEPHLQLVDFYVAFTGETIEPRIAGSKFLGRVSTTGLELHVFEVRRG